MKKIILILWILLLLTSCYSNSKDLEKIEELKGKVELDNFEKKKECISLEWDMRKQLEWYERYSSRMEWTTLYLTEVFYSPLKNSCLYKSEFIFNDIYKLEINDFFTKEIIFEKICDAWEWYDFSSCLETFNNELKKYK